MEGESELVNQGGSLRIGPSLRVTHLHPKIRYPDRISRDRDLSGQGFNGSVPRKQMLRKQNRLLGSTAHLV